MAVVTVPRTNFPVGSYPFGPFDVDVGLTRVDIALTRASWAAGVNANVRLELSLDGGATWSPDPSGQADFPWAAFPIVANMTGGPQKEYGGGISTHSWFGGALPQPDNAARQVRGVMVVTGGTLNSTITLTTV